MICQEEAACLLQTAGLHLLRQIGFKIVEMRALMTLPLCFQRISLLRNQPEGEKRSVRYFNTAG